jgi:FlaA1/EpsC-like NDP-sugar epimerase
MNCFMVKKTCYFVTGGAGFIGSNFIRHLLMTIDEGLRRYYEYYVQQRSS